MQYSIQKKHEESMNLNTPKCSGPEPVLLQYSKYVLIWTYPKDWEYKSGTGWGKKSA